MRPTILRAILTEALKDHPCFDAPDCWHYEAVDELARFRTCLRCGHQWQVQGTEPGTCASCRSPYWNKPRRTE